MKTFSVGALLGALAIAARASCGASFCTLMTDRYAQGAGDPHLGFSADLRLEAIQQDRLKSGTHGTDAAAAGDDTIERRTRNLNLVSTLSYGFDRQWSVSVRVPLVQRDHEHALADGRIERWNFTRLGDVQALLRREFAATDGDTAYALYGGLKLPTGAIDVANRSGQRAERALQPGTGSTDALLGVALRRALSMSDALIAQASVAQAIATRDDFRPGRRTELSLGWSHAYSHALGAVLQLNLRHRARDSGAQAEPEHSGSAMLDLSPGVTWGVDGASTLYAFVQLPAWQRVNGTQLVPRAAFAAGYTRDF